MEYHLPSEANLHDIIRQHQARAAYSDLITSNILDFDDQAIRSLFELQDLQSLNTVLHTFSLDTMQCNAIKQLIAKNMRKEIKKIDIYEEKRPSHTTSALSLFDDQRKKQSFESPKCVTFFEHYIKDVVRH